jgi:adenylate cyclase
LLHWLRRAQTGSARRAFWESGLWELGRRRQIRRGLTAIAAIVGLVCLFTPPGFVKLIELKLLDWHAALRGPLAVPPSITVVAIDEKSLEKIGRWPWPRTTTAELVVRLAQGGAKLITLDLLYNEPDQNSSLLLARDLADRYRQLGLGRAGGPAQDFGRVLEDRLTTADTDRALTEAVTATGRVVLPYVFLFPPAPATQLAEEEHRLLNRSRMNVFANRAAENAFQPEPAVGVLLPLPGLLTAAAATGHANIFPDRDGAVRSIGLLARFGSGYYPSFVLETARLAAGLPRSKVRMTAEQRLDFGTGSIPTDENGFMHLSYYGPQGAFRHLPAADILTASAPPAVDGHLVVVGFTAYGLMDVRPTPFDPNMPGIEIHATALANILEGRGLRRLTSMALLEAFVVLALAALSPLVLPRMGAAWSTVLLLGVATATVVAAHAAFRAGTLVVLLPLLAALAVGHVGGITYQVLVEERERRFIKSAFQQYVPGEVVDHLARNHAALAFGGERRAMTILFSDIRGYTTFSERHPPEEVVAVLREYLTAMVEAVFRNKGTLDKFIGDSVMALWGAPLDDPEHALNACRTAIEMQAALERLNAHWADSGRESLQAGIGIASGDVVVGNLGSDQRFSYTVMGDHVNLAARLEGLNKEYQTRRHIIISEDVYEQVRDQVTALPLGSVKVKGKFKAVDIYELVDVVPAKKEAVS